MNVGNYKILKQIGEGGFGRIYQAQHVLLEEMACLKQNKDPDRDAQELLRHEAKVLWKLYECHSIPTTKDFIQIDKNNCALVTTYIEGKTLADVLEGDKRMKPEAACWVTERLLGALYYIHHKGVVHSDIKPENVFVEPDKHDIKLIDFGLATYKPKHTTKPKGYTPKYAAPELLDGKPPIPETDIYGAGMVMLYALGGDVLKKSFRSDTPEELAEFCSALLRYDPMQRPNWGKENLITSLSDLRMNVFKRRHMSDT